jgi:hypothetical protein
MALDAEQLKRAARDATGLHDFGDAPLDEGLAVLVASLNETPATAKELAAAQATIMGALTERLRIEDWSGRHPDVLGQEIRRPVFVVGLPRSGTTALSQFLAEDPAARSLLRWEAMNAIPPPDPALGEDPRLAATRKAFEARDLAMPLYRVMLPVDADDPAEHSPLLGLTFMSMHVPLVHHAPAYQDWLLQQDLRPAYAYLKKVLQILQSKTGAPHWNLKAPLDIFGLDALVEVFPDARLVWCHRDPAKSVPSNCSLLSMIRTASGEAVDKVELGRMKMAVFAEGMRRALAARERIGEARFADVLQRDLVRDTVGTVEKLYGDIGLAFTDAYRARLTGRATQRGEAMAGKAHEYSLEDFGLSLPEIRREFGDYLARFKPPLEA